MPDPSDGDAALTPQTPPGITMKGYNGTVKEYAESKTYLNFETLYEDNRYFLLDQDGKLHLGDSSGWTGAIGDAVLPDDTKCIPAGIFDGVKQNGSISSEGESESGSDAAGAYWFTKLTIGEKCQLTTIEPGAFAGTAITSLELPAGVTEIADNTFKGAALTTINLLNVTAVGANAFENCTALIGKLEMPKVTAIGEGAFRNCATDEGKQLEAVFGASLRTLGKGAFQGSGVTAVVFGGENPTNPADPSDDMPLGEIIIPENAFKGCTLLKMVTFPDNCTGIEQSAFEDCSKLELVELPEKCTAIGASAFEGCAALTQMDLPESVCDIGNRAFYGCTALREVWIRQCADADTDTGESTIELLKE